MTVIVGLHHQSDSDWNRWRKSVDGADGEDGEMKNGDLQSPEFQPEHDDRQMQHWQLRLQRLIDANVLATSTETGKKDNLFDPHSTKVAIKYIAMNLFKREHKDTQGFYFEVMCLFILHLWFAYMPQALELWALKSAIMEIG